MAGRDNQLTQQEMRRNLDTQQTRMRDDADWETTGKKRAAKSSRDYLAYQNKHWGPVGGRRARSRKRR